MGLIYTYRKPIPVLVAHEETSISPPPASGSREPLLSCPNFYIPYDGVADGGKER